ncbi:MAG: hypothetical protein PUI41_12630 [Lachnospiraceae bacterium]|nr:hypothetical protein [Lachnospiraceae bacterium]
MSLRAKQKEAYEAPLTEYDTSEQTLGCRHTNPDICKYADVANVCAFVREDGMCMQPGRKWKKKYMELKGTD